MMRWTKRICAALFCLTFAASLYANSLTWKYLPLELWRKQPVASASERQQVPAISVVELPEVLNDELVCDIYSQEDQRKMVTFMLKTMLQSGHFRSKTDVVLELTRDSFSVPWTPNLYVAELANSEQQGPPYAVKMTFHKLKVIFNQGRRSDTRIASRTP